MKWIVISFLAGSILTIITQAFIFNGFKPIKNVVQTNSVYGEKVAYLTNAFYLTNSIVNIVERTNVLNIIIDYEGFHTNDFVFVQSNDNLSASLYTRSASTKLLPWFSGHKNMIIGTTEQDALLIHDWYSSQLIDVWVGGGYNFQTKRLVIAGSISFW